MHAQTRPFIAAITALVLAAPAIAQAPAKPKPEPTKSFIKVHEAEQPYTPIPLAEAAKASPMTQADAEAKFVEVEKRWMADSYLKNGDPRDPKLDDRVVAFLNKAAPFYVAVETKAVPKELGQEGLKLLEDGCKDPLVIWIAFFLGSESGVHQPKLEDMGAVLEVLATTKHTPARIALFARWLSRQCDAAGSRTGRIKASGIFLDQLARAVAQPNMDPMEQRYLATKLGAPMDDILADPSGALAITEAVLQTKGSPQWLRLTIGGMFHLRVSAMLQTAVDETHKSTPSILKDIDDHLAIAQKSLEQAHALCPQHPNAAREMIHVAQLGRHQPGQNCRYWLDQACKAQIDDEFAYQNYLDTIRPRAHGSIEAMRAFAQECMSVRRDDALSAPFAVYAYERICDDTADHLTAWQPASGLSDSCMGVLETAVANPKHFARADMYRTKLAAIAVRSGKWEVGRKALDGLGQPLLRDYAAAYRLLPEDIENAILPRTEATTRDIVLGADAKFASGDAKGACEEMQKAVSAATSNDKLKRAVHDLCEQVRVLAGLRGSDWIDLCVAADSSMPAWRSRDGSWLIRPRGAQKLGPGRGMQSFEVPVGDRFEFEATIMFNSKDQDWGSSSGGVFPPSKAKDPTKPRGGAGIIFGLSWERSMAGEWFGAMADPAAGQATIGYRNDPGSPFRTPISADAPARIRVVRFDNVVRIEMNGKPTYSGPVTTQTDWRMGPYIGLMLTRDNEYVAAGFKDVRVRRLTTSPFETKAVGVPTH